MKTAILSVYLLILSYGSFAQQSTRYKPLDQKHPIVFAGDYIVYKSDTIRLGPRAIFVDGQLPDSEIAKHKYVYNSVANALDHLVDGSEAERMKLYIAPYVYWIDDPDDPKIRVAEDGGSPYGKIVKCEWLQFNGLTEDAHNVVLASNRGQTIGAQGNFTMFKFIGQGTGSENITFGNYCNIDLVFPLLPKLNRNKRASAIVQAQLIHCNGDKIVARNTRFVSRLNLCPFTGGKRVLFDRCHFESTDDALCGTGVYLDCTLDFYGSKPFYSTSGTGAVFLNSSMRSFAGSKQFFTKAGGQVVIVDSRITSEQPAYIGWRDVPPAETRNYQYNVSLNGKPVLISKQDAAATVEMQNKKLLNAYWFKHNGKVVYNTYNLLAGDDDWDPMNIKSLVLDAAKGNAGSFTKLPVQLQIAPARVNIETGKDDVILKAKTLRFGNYPAPTEHLKWQVAPAFKSLVKLTVNDDGSSCTVTPLNNRDSAVDVVVMATAPSGLQAASLLTVAPSILLPPTFTTTPKIIKGKNGQLQVQYALDTKLRDQSNVTWYRCTNAKGNDPIEIAVSRFNQPLLSYALTAGDVGYYIKVAVAPKHTRSEPGKEQEVIFEKAIAASDVHGNPKNLATDFRNISVRNQPKVLPGFYTWESFDPPSTERKGNTNRNADAWYYGPGVDGAAGMTGLLQGRTASMRYTPVSDTDGDMKFTLTVAPFKEAGQGFSVAHLYMDVLVKLDTKTMSGYGLRLIRTTKHHDAVDAILVRYDDGKVTEISEPVSTTSFKTPCTITLETIGNKIIATCKTGATNVLTKVGVVTEVKINAPIGQSANGGFGIQYNGGSPTLVNNIKVDWK